MKEPSPSTQTTPIPPWAPCKRPLGCDYPDCECHSQTTRVRRSLEKVRRTWKRRFQSLHERLEWFHYETRERRYMLRVFGKWRLP